MAVETLSDLVFHIRERWTGRPALLSMKRGNRVESLSTSDFTSAIHSLALALEARGLAKGERVALFSENRPEWHIVDFACQLLGAVSVPIYPTLAMDQVGFILRNSGASWVFYSGEKRGELLEELRPTMTRRLRLVALDESSEAPEMSLVPLLGEGAELATSQPLDRLRGRAEPDDLASVIYTSGTTGDPKGVMLTHRNFVSNFMACRNLYPIGSEDVALSFLPLSHVFERTVDHLFLYRGVSIHYAPSIERVPPLLLEVKPTVLTSVPRLYERAFLRVSSNISKESPRRQRLFHWAMAVGKRWSRGGKRVWLNPFLAVQRFVARRLVFRRIQERFGGRLRFAISGGAPLSDQVAEFFQAVGIRLFQGYGLTETSPVLASNTPRHSRAGSVGRAIPSVELKIADDGEILARGPGVMAGYWENPAATEETMAPGGWLKTGDIGHLDDDGFLFITDRKKDILITSGGKNVPPQPIEQMLTSHPAIGQAIVVGDRYPYLTALLVPRFDELPDELAELPPTELIEHADFRRRVEKAVANTNRHLSEHERVRKWTLLPREFTEERGELTPTLKLRRRVITQKYADTIAGMYLKTQRVAG